MALNKTRLETQVQGTLPIANGGTGSSTKNFVDLSTNQTIAGEKSFSGNTSIQGDNKYIIIKETDGDERGSLGNAVGYGGLMTLRDNSGNVKIKLIGEGQTNQILGNLVSGVLLPEGTLINGKIVPSVSTGNLTVALKTHAGTDPSATDPVYAMIGGVMRTITSALSNTEGAGANRYNLGSAELATKEVDLFAYLTWNTNLSSVVLGYSRIPYGTKWGDFSATFSNEKFLWSGTGSAVTDPVINIGRFAATLSAGPSYTWSVPTYDSSNLIQRPCYETRWLYWKPTPSASGSMTFTSGTVYDCYYKVLNTDVIFNIQESGFTVGGTVSNELYLSLPFIPSINVLGQSSEIFNGSYYLGYASASNATGKVRFAKQDFSSFSLGNTSVNTAFEFPIKIG